MEIIPIAKLVNIMAMIQSVSPIEIAAKSERNWLFILAGWFVISALITGVLTVLLYKKTGKYQEVVKTGSDARIAASNAEAKKAGESAGRANERAGVANAEAGKANESAGKANERAQNLEGDNIKLRTDLESATAESRARQAELAKEQGKLAEEQRKTAKAQQQAAEAQLALKRHLEEVAERQRPRHLTPEQRMILLALLKQGQTGSFELTHVANDGESYDFARELLVVLRQAGWILVGGLNAGVSTVPPKGLLIIVQNDRSAPGIALQDALNAVGLSALGQVQPAQRADLVSLFVGTKP